MKKSSKTRRANKVLPEVKALQAYKEINRLSEIELAEKMGRRRMKTNFKNFVGTIEFLGKDGNETEMRSYAVLNGKDEDNIVSAIPFDMFEGGEVKFHQTIQIEDFKVVSISGDKISDLLGYISMITMNTEEDTGTEKEISLDDFEPADK